MDTDLHAFHASHPFRKPPMILGHEAAGEVVQVGAKVKNLKVGERITVEPLKACGKCSYCRSGNYNVCPERVGAGVRGWLGTFAEYFVLPEQRAYKLSPELDYDLGVLVEPLAVGTHAVRIANLEKNRCAWSLRGGHRRSAGRGRRAGRRRKPRLLHGLNRFRLQTAQALGLCQSKRMRPR